jgi:branched-subunit amino acid ABC-type transport system permease component
MLEDIAIQLLFGLARGSTLFLLAVGLSLIYGMLNVLNFAHGVLFMLGGFFSVSLLSVLGIAQPTLWIILLLIAPFLVSLVGVGFKFLLTPVVKGPREITEVKTLIFTIGLAMIFSALARTIWGADIYSFPKPSLIAGSINVLGRAIPAYDFLLVGLGLGIGIFLILLFFKTPTGVLTRAYQFDERIAAAMGVDTGRLSLIMFALGSFLAGLGGSLSALVGTVEFLTWKKVILEAFIVAIIGGLGSFRGVLLGAFLIGIIESLVIFFFARFGPWISWIAIYTVFVIVLIFRPKGIFGGRF